MKSMAVVLAAFVFCVPVGCSSPGDEGNSGASETRVRTVPQATGIAPEELKKSGDAAGIHNFAEVAPGLFRGAQPEGDASFALLASLGVKTILTVDGAKPDVEGAAKHGIRYIHVPIEYAGITPEEQLKIAKVGKEYGDGLYVHCHHGKHRGPAAMGIVWMTRDGVSNEAFVGDLKKAGCDPRYKGLYALGQSFVVPSDAELARLGEKDLPSRAETAGITDAMVKIDASFVRLKNAKKVGFKVSADHPDVNPPHEARIFAEHFRELARTPDSLSQPSDFQGWLQESEKASWELETAIEAGDAAAADKALGAVEKLCTSCHDKYRNNW
jgi:protein tyrosine phosphatase (PTP) superfamily phosphohydrolase (DUF442 family)